MKTENFAYRHIGPRVDEVEDMLQTIKANSLDELCEETIPASIRLQGQMNLPDAMSEANCIQHIAALGSKNKVHKSYIGMGYYPTHLPAAIQRNILENPGWYSAYTPYQAEIAQGRLEAVLNFQTMVCELTAMPLANASLLDESTAAAEAMSMLYSLRTSTQKKAEANKFFVDNNILPQTLAVLQSRSTTIGIELVQGEVDDWQPTSDCFGAIFQYPGKYGQLIDLQAAIDKAKSLEIKTTVAADIMSLALLEAPGTYGADVVVGSTQRFGIPMGYGDPHAGYFATKTEYKRSVPGRIIGVTQDKQGNRALRMALQTREQHIKRDRATSNICTAQVLLAVMAGMYAVHHGPEGLRQLARRIHNHTLTLYSGLVKLGIDVSNTSFFDTLQINCLTGVVKKEALSRGVNLNIIDDQRLSISISELTTDSDIEELIHIFSTSKTTYLKVLSGPVGIPASMQRSTPYLTQDVFYNYQSESALMRYIKQLERKDLSLTHSMIALGSCTMKLNAAAELLPLSNPEWGNIHPFAPLDQVQGYQHILKELENDLSEITGFTATSLQPNSGAQGEFSGLMVIRSDHEARGDQHRNICLIPSSAHGTNPASAVMAGMRVVVVGTDKHGNINEDELREKAMTHAENLAALMITYPSTHGVFESSIQRITKVIHDCGGQVYMDGANMNAQVGLTNPALIGADVCHLNLHKTFAIPHGGGGPGVGPICVAKHLASFLPSHPFTSKGDQSVTISGAPWGSAMICLISYAYIRMLGAKGLKRATEIAILNANYIKARLEKHYEILYKG